MTQTIKLGTAMRATFEVVDARRATGFGLHVAASPEANGRGVYAEFFLQASGAGEVEFVYFDGGRSVLPFVGSVTSLDALPVLGDISVVGPEPEVEGLAGMDLGSGVSLDVSPAVSPAVPDSSLSPAVPDSSSTSVDLGTQELRGQHRFRVKLGQRDDIGSIVVSLSGRELVVDCGRQSTHRQGPSRIFYLSVSIPQVEGDLGSRPELFYSSNGLLSPAVDVGSGNVGAGSGWITKNPEVSLDGGGSDDGSLLGSAHSNNDSGNDPTGG